MCGSGLPRYRSEQSGEDHRLSQGLAKPLNSFTLRSATARAALGWLIWASLTATCGFILINRASTVEPTPQGLEFVNIQIAYLGFSPLPLLASGVVAALTCVHRIRWWLLSLVLTIGAWGWVHSKLSEIEFVRTPPCWGLHSIDPGSGEGCPTGMRKDFTVSQLRDYYKR